MTTMSKPVLFASFRPLERAENICAAYEAYTGEKVHIISTSPEYRSEVLSGKYDVLVTDDFPAVTPGKCIVIWHGIYGGKRVGLDQPGVPYYRREYADNMTYIISASNGMVNGWNKSTGVPKERILPLGMPRTDQYVGKVKGDGHTILADKHAYLYAPTFRDKGETPMPDIDWGYIDSILTDDEVFAVKAHPWQMYQHGKDQVTQNMSGIQWKHIMVIGEDQPSAPYLYDADVIITDYSSIMFDAYLLNKPVVLFEKTPGYTETRGMYLDYPFDYCTFYALNEEQLINNLRYRAKFPFLTNTELRCRVLVADKCDGHVCERLNKLIDTIK